MPRTSFAFTFEPASSSAFTDSSGPLVDARINAVKLPRLMGPFFTTPLLFSSLTAFASAPLDSSNFTMAVFPRPAAFISGVEVVMSLEFTSSPASRKIRTASRSFAAVALSRPLNLLLSTAFTFAPLAIRRRRIGDDPSVIDASSRAVCPCFETAFTSAPCSTSSRTLLRSVTDHISAVESKAFFVLTSAPLSIRTFIASADPTAAAYISGVNPRPSLWLAALEPPASIAFSLVRSFPRMAE